jgi:hypothetical protein
MHVGSVAIHGKPPIEIDKNTKAQNFGVFVLLWTIFLIAMTEWSQIENGS